MVVKAPRAKNSCIESLKEEEIPKHLEKHWNKNNNGNTVNRTNRGSGRMGLDDEDWGVVGLVWKNKKANLGLSHLNPNSCRMAGWDEGGFEPV